MLDHVALYGNVSMARSFCEKCKTFAFVLDGRIQCCNTPVAFSSSGIRRMSEPERKRRNLPLPQRHRILQAQDYRCLYCEKRFGSTVQIGLRIVMLSVRWDHMDPYCYSFNNHSENFAAACQFCNGWKSGFSFRTLEEIKIYVKDKWASAMPIPGVRQELREAEAVAEVLQPGVSGSLLESPKSPHQRLIAKPGPSEKVTIDRPRRKKRSYKFKDSNAFTEIAYPATGQCLVCKGLYQVDRETEWQWWKHHPDCLKACQLGIVDLAKLIPASPPQRKKGRPAPSV